MFLGQLTEVGGVLGTQAEQRQRGFQPSGSQGSGKACLATPPGEGGGSSYWGGGR